MIETVHAGSLGSDPTTFWIQCYAHEAYVAASLESAFEQLGPPLDILVTDDASPDRTFEIASALAQRYSGHHRVSLIRSEANRGIFRHINEVLPYLTGEFIVWQSSDDIALPDRALRLRAAAAAPGMAAAWSNHRLIDSKGRDHGISLPPDRPYRLALDDYAEGRCFDFTYGGSLGFSREIFDRFGPLPDRSAGLEHLLGFRAALIGDIAYLPAPLVQRRRHASSLTGGMGATDRSDDPLAVHERRLAKRLSILANLRAQLAHPAAAGHDDLARRLAIQTAGEASALDELRRYRTMLAMAADADAPECRHAGRLHDPPALTLVDSCGPGLNLLAYQGRYYAVPRRLGRVEPCGLRHHAYPGVLSGWTLAELAAVSAAAGAALELPEGG